MRGFLKLVLTDIKLYVREPIATFFTIVLPPVLVILFGSMFGNKPNPDLGGLGSMDVTMPAYTAMVLGIVGFMSLPITIASYRESGVLKRFRCTPIRPLTFIAAELVSNLVMMLAGVGALVATGRLLYHVAFGGNAFLVFLAIVFCALSMFSIGFLIAAVAPTARTANVIGLLILYPMMFLSGATIPLEVMPETVHKVADALPLTHAVTLLRGLWFGEAWGDHLVATAVLLGVLVVCTGLAARFFRWE